MALLKLGYTLIHTHTHIGISGSKWNRGAKVGSVDYFNRKGDFSWYLGQMTQKVC